LHCAGLQDFGKKLFYRRGHSWGGVVVVVGEFFRTLFSSVVFLMKLMDTMVPWVVVVVGSCFIHDIILLMMMVGAGSWG